MKKEKAASDSHSVNLENEILALSDSLSKVKREKREIEEMMGTMVTEEEKEAYIEEIRELKAQLLSRPRITFYLCFFFVRFSPFSLMSKTLKVKKVRKLQPRKLIKKRSYYC